MSFNKTNYCLQSTKATPKYTFSPGPQKKYGLKLVSHGVDPQENITLWGVCFWLLSDSLELASKEVSQSVSV